MQQLKDRCDVLVVGGGINGTGVARDAAGRGLTTVLCEQHDLASHTSSASTKLVHGGLRYLEYYDFVLVRKSLLEREVLLASAPHLSWPLRFVLPHDSHLRPAWMIRAGLFLYDHLARRKRLAASKTIDLRRHPAGQPLESRYRKGFEYSDGWVDDARLVAINALDAREHGADVLTRTACVGLRPEGDAWYATLQDAQGSERMVRARLVVNAAGPWVAQFLDACTPAPARHHPRMIRGSHIVVRKLFDHEYAYIFQAPDGRIVFAVPYEGEFTLIGTTESEYTGDLAHPAIAAVEQAYLLDMVNRYFQRDLGVQDVVWTFAGLRPLLAASQDDPKSVTRDFVLDFNRTAGPPLLSIYGGKLTTYRKLAETVVDAIAPMLGNTHGAWTARTALPGGDMPDADFDRFVAEMRALYPWLEPTLLQRYARAYGTRMRTLLDGCSTVADLGCEVLPGLYEREIAYLRNSEFAVTADDILFRRSKLGLHLGAGSVAVLDAWLSASPARGRGRPQAG
jgi:glycerol-3-phosphate dehydrogenase